MDATKVNTHQVERIASTVLGGGLLMRSLFRQSLSGDALAIGLLYRGISGHSFLYQALGVSTANEEKQQVEGNLPEQERSITIGKSADELYRFWRDPQNFAKIMENFAEVTEISQGKTHWRMQVPVAKKTMEWDMEITEEYPGELLRWKSLAGAQIPNEGSIHFHPAPSDWGTEVTLRFRFDPPGGTIGNTVAQRLGIVPRTMAEKALRRFKSLIETGEIPTLKNNPSAREKEHVHV